MAVVLRHSPQSTNFDEIMVHRVNVVEHFYLGIDGP